MKKNKYEYEKIWFNGENSLPCLGKGWGWG